MWYIRFLTVAIAFLLVSAIQARVAESSDELVLELRTEEGIRTFELSDKPEITFSENSIFVFSGDFVTSFHYSDIENIHFVINGVTDVEAVQIEQNTIAVRFTDGVTFVVEGVNEGENAAVYALSGMMMPLYAERSGNRLVVHLDAYPHGTYIVRIANQSYKIIKR